MISVVIGANNVYPEIGLTIGVDKKEDFDFGTLELKNTTKEDLYVFGDSVTITIGTKVFRRIVETDNRTKIADGIYDHLITLTEHTAKLTKNIYADRFFTVKSNGTSYELLDMAEVIQDTEPLNNSTPLFTIASATQTALGVEGKQIKMQTQNTFQKLSKIFKGIKAVPRLDYLDELSHVYYNQKNNPITLSDVLGDNKRINANDYGNTIVTKARNLAFDNGKFADDVTVFPTLGFGITPRSSTGDYSDVKAEWQLPLAFREWRKVKIMNLDTNTQGSIEADISDYVVDKETWEGLEVGKNLGGQTTPVQRNTLYISKGDTKVLNAGVEYDNLIGTIAAIQALIDSWFLANAPSENPIASQDISTLELYFEYLPYVDADITRERYDNDVTKQAQILSQQRETVLDFKRYAGVLNDTARRKSNGDWVISVLHASIDDIFDTGDYTTDNYQVIKASYIVWSETQIEGIYEFSKNWATLQGQQSTNREPQPYTMARESMDSKFRLTEYIEFSTDNALNDGHITLQGMKTLLNLFDYDAADNIPVRLAQYSSADDNVGSGAINVSTYSKAVDGGLNIFFEFNERILAGNQLDTIGNDELIPINYANSGGGVELFSIQYVNKTTISPNIYPLGVLEFTPLIEFTDIPVYKDPNEILKLNYELLWTTDEPDKIIIGEQFNVYNYLVHGLTKQDVNLAIYTIDPNVKIDDMTGIIPSYLTKTVNNAGQIVVNKSLANPYIDVSAVTNTDTKTWAIGFAVDDSLVMAVNYDGTDSTRIYFNNVLTNKERL